MYQIEDTVAALKEVQRLLGITQTGVFDVKTKSAITLIQEENSIEVKDMVDYATFEAILRRYRYSKAQADKSDYLFLPAYPYSLNDMDENVRLINNALRLVLEEYVYEDTLPSGKFLSSDTIRSANFLQRIFKMPVSDKINADFVNRLILEKNAIEIKRKYG